MFPPDAGVVICVPPVSVENITVTRDHIENLIITCYIYLVEIPRLSWLG